MITAEYGLGKGQPLMNHQSLCLTMFEAGGKFYLWYRGPDNVAEITSPTDLDEIVTAMEKDGMSGLETHIFDAP